jgi:hypothetical protein
MLPGGVPDVVDHAVRRGAGSTYCAGPGSAPADPASDPWAGDEASAPRPGQSSGLRGLPRGAAARRAVAPDGVTAQPRARAAQPPTISAPGTSHPAQHVRVCAFGSSLASEHTGHRRPVRLLGADLAPEGQHRDHLQIRQQSPRKKLLWERRVLARRQSHVEQRDWDCPGGRLVSADPAPETSCLTSSTWRADLPDPNTHTAAHGPPLLYFSAVLAVRSVRIMLLTSGAKEIRTPDLLHAIWRQHVHPRPSPQVTVLPRPCAATRVPVCCCTSVLYRCHPAWSNQSCPQTKP